jgi:hypothetical protein
MKSDCTALTDWSLQEKHAVFSAEYEVKINFTA